MIRCLYLTRLQTHLTPCLIRTFLKHVLLGQVFVYEARIPRSSGLIGKASVGLREFVDVRTNVQWVILKDANGVYAGEVCLVLRYTKTSQTGIN
jgi:hypothetical protein